jgi:hypothetical protein
VGTGAQATCKLCVKITVVPSPQASACLLSFCFTRRWRVPLGHRINRPAACLANAKFPRTITIKLRRLLRNKWIAIMAAMKCTE